MVNTLGASSDQTRDVLDSGSVIPDQEFLRAYGCVDELVPANIIAVGNDVVVLSNVLLMRDAIARTCSATVTRYGL